MVGHISRGTLFYPSSPHFWTRVLIVLATLIGVGLPVRIWNTTRIERKLVEQEKALLQARMDALISQINPHFLFNTLNTISSLIRFDPDTARTVLLKLSNILRRRLKAQVHFAPLQQELDFIDDYLDIEVVRFGRDKLQIRKEIDPETLDMVVPSMILQPLVENALRHGIAPKIEGGAITLRAQRGNGRLIVEVIDDGVGISEQRQTEVYGSGIGISNVRERLKVVYGQDFLLKIDSQPGKGTAIRFEIPELVTTLPAAPWSPLLCPRDNRLCHDVGSTPNRLRKSRWPSLRAVRPAHRIGAGGAELILIHGDKIRFRCREHLIPGAVF